MTLFGFRLAGANHCTDLDHIWQVVAGRSLRPEKSDPNQPIFGDFQSENPQIRYFCNFFAWGATPSTDIRHVIVLIFV